MIHRTKLCHRGSLLHGIWDLSSPAGDWPCIPCIARQILNHWTTREVPVEPFQLLFPHMLLCLKTPQPVFTRQGNWSHLSVWLFIPVRWPHSSVPCPTSVPLTTDSWGAWGLVVDVYTISNILEFNLKTGTSPKQSEIDVSHIFFLYCILSCSIMYFLESWLDKRWLLFCFTLLW